jgi:hypothetical protein
MSETMVERVAKAIYEKRNGPGCYPWGNRTKGHKAPYLADARAAIEAMYEPTEQMTKAACVEADKHGYYHTRGYFGIEEADYSWKAMVSAALATLPGDERE